MTGVQYRIDWSTAGPGAAGALVGVGLIAILAAASMGRGEDDSAPDAALVYLDIAPRALLPDEPRRRPERLVRTTERERTRAAVPATDAPPAPAPSSVQPDVASTDDLAAMQEAARRNAIARSLRRRSFDCSALLDEIEREACRHRFARHIEGAPQIAGTGDAGRDALFARQGARRLAAWEAQRASSPSGDPPCETPHPVAGCEGVNIQVDLFSSRDGFLPNLRKRRE